MRALGASALGNTHFTVSLGDEAPRGIDTWEIVSLVYEFRFRVIIRA